MAKKSQAKKAQPEPSPGDADTLPTVMRPARARNGRNASGQWVKGYSGSMSTDAARARRNLNASTIAGMQWAFDKYGRQAIEKVAKSQPAIFLKMLVLLVPRELEVTHSAGPKGMSDEQLEAAVTAIEGFLAKRVEVPGDSAKVVEAVADNPSADKA